MNLIKIKGKDYPCRVTMGAMVRFNRMAGYDVSEMDSQSMTDMIMFVYCCVKSACKADDVDFSLDFETFADSLEPGALNEFYASMSSGSSSEEKKTV